MYNKNAIEKKLNEIKIVCAASPSATIETAAGSLTITGSDKAKVLDSVFTAVGAYFARDEVLRTQVMYVIHQLYGDLMRRHMIYTGGPEPPPCRVDYPAGYDDVTALFTGSGVLPEIMAIAPDEFAASIAVDAEGAVSSSLAESWTVRLSAARAGEMAALDALLNFCKSGGFEGGLYIAFEEYKKVEMPLKKQDLARMIYQEKGFAELIAAFQLAIPLPSYMTDEGKRYLAD